MGLIKWDEALSVNIDSIDEQHKKIVDLLNDFYDHIQNRSSKESVSKLINGMKLYTSEHFAYEEKYMLQYNFWGFAEHKKEHDLFVDKVTEVEEKFNAGKLVISLEITNFLKAWVKDHIKGMDQKYSDFFVAKGLK